MQNPYFTSEHAATAAFESPQQAGLCPYCQKQRLRPTDIFCSLCGSAVRIEALHLCTKCKTPLIEGAHFCYQCGQSTVSAPPVRVLTLIFMDNPQMKDIVLTGDKDSYSVGRTVPEQNHFVDIDLGQVGQRKISRNHATLSYSNGEWYVEDTSQAGTYIHFARLEARTKTLLENGVQLKFADVAFRVKIS